MAVGRAAILLALAVGLCLSAAVRASNLKVGFYAESCPKAEEIVREALMKALEEDAGIGADILRMHFHDCFIRGCDASLFVDSTKDHKAEKDGDPNKTIEDEAFEVIDDVKKDLEAACKQTVSCADMLAFLARDSIVHYGGKYYDVPAGRRDGLVSNAKDTDDLPPPTFKLNQLTKLFVRKGLSRDDMVTLSGAHTIGVAHCSAFSDRLYNFTGKLGTVDLTLNYQYAGTLRKTCPLGNTTNQVDMDPASPLNFDTSYFNSLLDGRGLFTSDEALLSTSATRYKVKSYAKNPALFKAKFARSMIKMGKIQVLTGEEGTIRTNCRVINYH